VTAPDVCRVRAVAIAAPGSQTLAVHYETNLALSPHMGYCKNTRKAPSPER